jgi:hypothetical protein
MTRRLVQVLLLMFALQFSWSAVSAYCIQETGLVAQHSGHHQHQADRGDGVVSIEPGNATGSKKVVSAHSHCSSCNQAISTPAALEQAMPVRVANRVFPVANDAAFTSLSLSRPERPQWRGAT